MNSFYKEVLKNLLRFHRIAAIPKSDIMFTAHDVDRGFIYGGRAYSQLVDSVAEHFDNLTCVTIATPFSKLTGQRAHGRVFAVNGKFARALILRFIMRKLARHSRRPICAVSDVWSQILRQVRPKIIIGIQPSKELCVAAREFGIQVFDLQHGVLSDEGYYGAGYRADIQQQGWPNGILCWDQASAEWFYKNCGGRSAIVVGHPWISRFVFEKSTDKLVQKISKNLRLPQRSPKVLVTLTWGLQSFGVTPSPIGIVQEVIDAIVGNKIDCQWLLRLHPMQIQGSQGTETLGLLKKTFGHMSNVEWEITSSAPLPLILQQTDVHLTCMSSVILEAARFGIKSGVVFENVDLVRQWYGPYLEQGWATSIPFKKDKIVDWLEANLKIIPENKKLSLQPFAVDLIFHLAKLDGSLG